jgi:hypothetical protein
MKTIEEIAKDLCICAEVGEKCSTCPNNDDGCNNRRCSDFREYRTAKEAIRIAQRWIPVKEELPETVDMVIVKIEYEPTSNLHTSGTRLQFITMGSCYIGSWDIIHTKIMNGYHAKTWEVTHWRHIELK